MGQKMKPVIHEDFFDLLADELLDDTAKYITPSFSIFVDKHLRTSRYSTILTMIYDDLQDRYETSA